MAALLNPKTSNEPNIHRWLNGCIVIYKEIWHMYEKNNKHCSVNESHRHMLSEIRDTKEHMLKDSIYMKLKNR